MAAQRSPVILYEDDKPLGPAPSRHDEVEYVGRGRYSHWKDIGILMSTSDNTKSQQERTALLDRLANAVGPSPGNSCARLRLLPLPAHRP